jgi:hypothetical protein
MTSQGEYISTSFTGSNGTWHLIGTESPSPESKPLDSLDTFSNGQGKFNTITRRKVAQLYQEKKIFI